MYKKAALAVLLAGFAVLVGFALAMGFISAINFVSPFQPGDDDTLRERLPVVLAYLIWGTSALGVFILGWRASRRAS